MSSPTSPAATVPPAAITTTHAVALSKIEAVRVHCSKCRAIVQLPLDGQESRLSPTEFQCPACQVPYPSDLNQYMKHEAPDNPLFLLHRLRAFLKKHEGRLGLELVLPDQTDPEPKQAPGRAKSS